MNIKKIRTFFLGFLSATLIFCTTNPAMAAMIQKTITVSEGVNIYVNNSLLSSANGFIYNGTTYLPVKAVSQALGQEVSWNGDTKSVYIGTQPASTTDNSSDSTSNSIGIGSTLSYGGWDIKVDKVKFESVLSTTFRENIAKGRYVVVLAKFTNNASYEREVGTKYCVKDSLGRTYEMDSQASLGYHSAFNTETWHLEDIGASFSATVPLVFDVPIGAKDLIMYPTDEPTADTQGITIVDEVE